jgi:ABC-type lipoprotein release transport system permease subunit
MSKWLQNFAYRIQVGWGTFILAGILALLIALIAVNFQAVKAALANPVEALRYE